ncbi:hypothetical protein AFULGI_00016340 [Archaeoglobus fulgidus DSM 8774]|uniref:Uncharacterized protein n=1 Tax=Archaeoglobus fulgidus DSM 8774 TaxID=1344584 RepID=A0A075WD86_ARCFL|nr:hypothetical protein [Archaeoglobus fulgidus]AIG98395.1 hypothetical protein AFULGI_00016340 [Archaeoglobus fulgidus DSM 8774]
MVVLIPAEEVIDGWSKESEIDESELAKKFGCKSIERAEEYGERAWRFKISDEISLIAWDAGNGWWVPLYFEIRSDIVEEAVKKVLLANLI